MGGPNGLIRFQTGAPRRNARRAANVRGRRTQLECWQHDSSRPGKNASFGVLTRSAEFPASRTARVGRPAPVARPDFTRVRGLRIGQRPPWPAVNFAAGAKIRCPGTVAFRCRPRRPRLHCRLRSIAPTMLRACVLSWPTTVNVPEVPRRARHDRLAAANAGDATGFDPAPPAFPHGLMNLPVAAARGPSSGGLLTAHRGLWPNSLRAAAMSKRSRAGDGEARGQVDENAHCRRREP